MVLKNHNIFSVLKFFDGLDNSLSDIELLKMLQMNYCARRINLFYLTFEESLRPFCLLAYFL